MRTIEVQFPVSGPPTVVHGKEAVLGGEGIVWEIDSDNPKIEEFLLRFDDAGATFFNGANTLSRPMDLSGKTIIWGTAPKSSDRRDKYSIQGLDGDGNVVEELDPMIITVQ